MDRGKLKAFSYVANEVHARLGDDAIVSLSRIAHLPEDSKALRSILADVRDSSAGEFPLELRGADLFGLGVVHAIIFHAATFASRGKRVSGARA
jgi:hypothetical protein